MSQARLLLVDDEERILRSLSLVFRGLYEVWATSNPDQALQWVQQSLFHVVICDQRMPSLPGVELLRRIRQLSPDSVRLLLTGYSDIPAIIASINEGEIWRYITKPWEPSVLLDTVAHAVEIGLQRDRQLKGTSLVRAARREPVPLLVYDEDPDVAPALGRIAGEHFSISAAATLESTLEFIARQQAPILITEAMLGGIETTATIRSLKHACPDLTVIVLSARQDSGLLIQLVNQCQIFRFLSKPMVPQRVLEGLTAAKAHHSRLLAGRPTGLPVFRQEEGAGLSARIVSMFRKFKDESRISRN